MTRTEKRLVALLPIKAHSERIPGKNFRPFCGKPLLLWVLDTLLSLKAVEQVVINTDAPAKIRRFAGRRPRILLRERKPSLRGDKTSMNRVLADDVENVPAAVYLMTHVTNPLLSPASILAAVRRFRAARARGSADSLFTVNRVQTRFYRADGSPVNHDPDRLLRTQDLEPWFEENSNLYLFTRESFRRRGARVGARPILHELPRTESADIDDIEGWRLAEALALYARRAGRRRA